VRSVRPCAAKLPEAVTVACQKVAVAPADKDEMMKVSKDVGQKLVGRLYSQELLSMVQTP